MSSLNSNMYMALVTLKIGIKVSTALSSLGPPNDVSHMKSGLWLYNTMQ